MNDTHINAYYGAVDLAKAELAEAQAKYDNAVADLKAKKQEAGVVDEVEISSSAHTTSVSRDAGDGQFVTKEEAKANPKTTVTEKFRSFRKR